jgi:hypothetical protein
VSVTDCATLSRYDRRLAGLPDDKILFRADFGVVTFILLQNYMQQKDTFTI